MSGLHVVVTCPKCHGTGIEDVPTFDRDQCTWCGGLGFDCEKETPPDGLYRVVGGKVERVEADEETLARLIWEAYYPTVRFDGWLGGDENPPQAYQAARAVLKALGA